MKPEIGKTYLINFVDKNYPCKCPCHTNRGILHIVACCSDRSYNGPAKCTGRPNYLPDWAEKDREDYWLFDVHEYRTLLIHESSIISELI